LGSENQIVVTAAGGFVGGNLVAEFRGQGFARIQVVGIKPFEEWYQRFDEVENLSLDLNIKENCETAADDTGDIYNLPANMGGMGFMEHNQSSLHALRSHQHANAAGGGEVRRETVLLFFFHLRLQPRQTEEF
jgi:uncharacterized protein YbjT (DUF2867 family)